MILPIHFAPLTMERIWGGRRLATIYQRALPDAPRKIGESWEIVDRPDEQSIVTSGAHAGKSLHQLWSHHREEIFGKNVPHSERFPILIKILDACDDLSIQVHPPTHLADSLKGEPKTEMWVIAAATPDAKLYVGLKKGISREDFNLALQKGSVATCVHTLFPKAGESIFIPSGRLHAIGAGLLIHEIQQNSDTTYRVFDWNRVDDSGNPRELHIEKSLASIDFSDVEPTMDQPNGNTLASCPFFTTTRHHLQANEAIDNPTREEFSLIGIVSGELRDAAQTTYPAGTYLLLPAGASPLTAPNHAEVLQVVLPHE